MPDRRIIKVASYQDVLPYVEKPKRDPYKDSQEIGGLSLKVPFKTTRGLQGSSQEWARRMHGYVSAGHPNEDGPRIGLLAVGGTLRHAYELPERPMSYLTVAAVGIHELLNGAVDMETSATLYKQFDTARQTEARQFAAIIFEQALQQEIGNT